jgi:hypothetical protein
MRDDARAGLQLFQQTRTQLEIDRRQQVHRHDRGLADSEFEQIFAVERNAVGDALQSRTVNAFRDAVRVKIDTDAACAEFSDRCDHDAAVARA